MSSLLRFFRLSSRSVRAYAVFIEPAQTYSLQEKDTGERWIDGRTIFKKTINVGALPNTGLSQTAHNIANLDRVISWEVSASNGSGVELPIGLVDATSPFTAAISVAIAAGTVDIVTANDRSAFTGFVTVKYVK